MQYNNKTATMNGSGMGILVTIIKLTFFKKYKWHMVHVNTFLVVSECLGAVHGVRVDFQFFMCITELKSVWN